LGNSPDDIQFYVQEQRGNSINTKILNEYRVINGFHCRKAIFFHPTNPDIPVASAWFCSDINIKAGPADLSGLPGLIVEAEHHQTRETYSLIRFNEMLEEATMNYWPEQFNGISFTKLTGISAVNR
jgi:GLPGLI family protein